MKNWFLKKKNWKKCFSINPEYVIIFTQIGSGRLNDEFEPRRT